jgi:hypothetical protein
LLRALTIILVDLALTVKRAGGECMSDAVNEAELGRSKQSTSPSDHLIHLLTIGWDPDSPLIQKYVGLHGLHQVLNRWRESLKKFEDKR